MKPAEQQSSPLAEIMELINMDHDPKDPYFSEQLFQLDGILENLLNDSGIHPAVSCLLKRAKPSIELAAKRQEFIEKN